MTETVRNFQNALEYCKNNRTSLPEGRQKDELGRLAEQLTKYNKTSTWLNIIKLDEIFKKEGVKNIYYGEGVSVYFSLQITATEP